MPLAFTQEDFLVLRDLEFVLSDLSVKTVIKCTTTKLHSSTTDVFMKINENSRAQSVPKRLSLKGKGFTLWSDFLHQNH